MEPSEDLNKNKLPPWGFSHNKCPEFFCPLWCSNTIQFGLLFLRHVRLELGL